MKKSLIIALALMCILSGCTAAATEQTTSSPAASATPEVTPSDAATAAPTPSPTPEATTAPAATAAPTQAASSSFATAEVSNDTVEAAVAGLFKEGEFTGVSTDNSAGNIYITIYFKPAAYADEKDFMLQAGSQAAPVMEALFTNPTVLEVYFYADADLKDSDGNTAQEDVAMFDMTKDKAAGTDWAKLKEAAAAGYQAMLDAVDNYSILPEFSDKLK